jgi:hypothetical protein
MRTTLALGLIALALSGCGGSTTTIIETSSSPSASGGSGSGSGSVSTYTMPASPSPTSCTVYLPGHAVRVTFSSGSVDVAPACQSLIQTEAAGGLYWSLTPSTGLGTNPDDLTANCAPTNTSGGVTAVVEDEPAGFYGQQVCSQLVTAGWIEQTKAVPQTTPQTTAPAVIPLPADQQCPRGYAPLANLSRTRAGRPEALTRAHVSPGRNLRQRRVLDARGGYHGQAPQIRKRDPARESSLSVCLQSGRPRSRELSTCANVPSGAAPACSR